MSEIRAEMRPSRLRDCVIAESRDWGWRPAGAMWTSVDLLRTTAAECFSGSTAPLSHSAGVQPHATASGGPTHHSYEPREHGVSSTPVVNSAGPGGQRNPSMATASITSMSFGSLVASPPVQNVRVGRGVHAASAFGGRATATAIPVPRSRTVTEPSGSRIATRLLRWRCRWCGVQNSPSTSTSVAPWSRATSLR